VYPYDKDYYSNVSSAALNNAFANHMPVITYPTASFKEIRSQQGDALSLTESFSYYELARAIKLVDLKSLKEGSREFAELFSYPTQAPNLVRMYKELTESQA